MKLCPICNQDSLSYAYSDWSDFYNKILIEIYKCENCGMLVHGKEYSEEEGRYNELEEN